MKKEVRGTAGETKAETATRDLAAAAARDAATKKAYTEAEKTACSIDAMRNGGTCEACQ